MTPNKRKQELRDVKLIKSGEVMRPTESSMASFSATSVFSQEHMASFSAAVFSHAELAKNPGFENNNIDFKSEVCDDASTAEAPSPLRKRKATSAVSLVSLDRSIEEESILAARDPKEMSFLSGCKDSTGVMLLSFPMKLHWMLYECELAHRAKQKSTKKPNEDNKKPKAVIACDANCDDKIIIGWLPSGTAFKIFDQDRFVKEIMPSYFAGTFKDFQRDLELW